MINRKNPFRFYCHFDFKFVTFDFSNNNFDFQSLSRLISQMHFWFPKFDVLDSSNDTFDFQNLTRFDFSNNTFDFQNQTRFDFSIDTWFPKLLAFDFSNDTFDFQNFVSLQLGVAHLFDEFTRDLWLFCSLLVFGCHVRPRNWWKWYILLWNLVIIMYVYCSMFYVSLQLSDMIKIRVRKETLFTTNEQDVCKQ